MTDTELFNILALLRVEGVGDVVAKKLINHFGSAKPVLTASRSQILAIGGVGEVLYKNLKNEAVFKQAAAELQFIQTNNIKVTYYKDADYPEKLKHCIDSPVLLFSSGNIDLINRKTISIVGTRQITGYGTDFIQKFIKDIAPLNPVIISGFAYGVDIQAHLAAVEHNLQTIGVLAHGLNQVYPKTHKKYTASIEANGGFFTEFWSTSKPDRENFVRRNRIVAGISDATVIVESAEKGGSLITANIANDYNRDVFAVPGRVTDKYSKGCNDLIKTQRANLLTSAEDFIYMMNWEAEQEKEKTVQKQLFITLEADEQKIYDYLQGNGKEQMDIIALQCEIPVFKLSSILLTMELKGVIRPLPGKMFEAV